MKEHYYLDNAATTWPKPETVYTSMDQLFRQYGVNPGRAGHELAVEAERIIVDTRRLLAEFFNFRGDPNRVVFSQNATDSLNAVLFGLLGRGDHVVSTRVEHNSVLRPLNHLERDHGVEVTRVGRDEQGYVDPEDIRRALRRNTRLVLVNHASNVLGAVQDIAAIGRICREHGVLLAIDSCQSAGVLPIDMEAAGVHLLTFTGHKGLLGPMGIGGMVVAEDVELPHARVGGTGVESVREFQPDDYPHRLEAGTVNFPGIAGLNAAQRWFAELGRSQLEGSAETPSHRALCERALEVIVRHELSHINRLADAFRALEGVEVYGPRGNRPRVAVLSMNIAGLPPERAGDMLDADYHVCVRAGLHCAPLVHVDQGTLEGNGAVRFSPGYFTEDEDIDHVIEAVRELSELPTPA